MFLDSSRYRDQKIITVTMKDGRTVSAVTIRRLPDVKGDPTVVKGNDRLDVLSQTCYGDATKFWHIADANTELQARDLIKVPGRSINIPEG